MTLSIRPTDVIVSLLVLAGILLVALGARAADTAGLRMTKLAALDAKAPPEEPEEDTPQVAKSSVVSSERAPVYRPPRRGAPRSKVGGGMRGARAWPEPLALAPDHLAQTVSGQPSLFWYIDTPPSLNSRLLFTLIDDTSVSPLAEIEIEPPRREGIYRIRLGEHGVQLETDVEYEWSITLVLDPEHRSRDIITNGYIRRVPEPAELEQRGRSVCTYAELGLWYDALAAASDAIEARPGDPQLLEVRDALLRQVNLTEAVD